MPRKDPLLKGADFAAGGVERNGPYVSMSRENGCFIIYRHPDHPAGHAMRCAPTLRLARKISSDLRNEKPKESVRCPASS